LDFRNVGILDFWNVFFLQVIYRDNHLEVLHKRYPYPVVEGVGAGMEV
jgi:hypothetical protein